ncbi:MAG: alpha/beta hydrolase [Candidatus Omnitrophica bacterium]|nr:alpha/beta hydrolase [Candidatus Omnitrophota bacterium]
MQSVFYIVVTVVLLAAGVRYLESRSVFYPARSIAATPAALGLAFEDVFIKTEDNVTINAWLIKSSTQRGTLIFCHGNAGNIGDRLEKILLFHQMGLNVLIIDYRGYGESQGRPSEAGIYKDAVAAYDYLLTRRDIDRSRIIGYGESLGGAVAVDLGTKRNLAALIIDSSFTNAADMAKTIYPFIPSFLLGTKLDSVSKVRAVTIPKIFIHSRADEIVPFRLGERLYQAAAQPKEFLELPGGGGHNDTPVDAREKMAREIVTFLRRHNVIKRPGNAPHE